MTLWANASFTLPTFGGIGLVVRRERGVSVADAWDLPFDYPDQGIGEYHFNRADPGHSAGNRHRNKAAAMTTRTLYRIAKPRIRPAIYLKARWNDNTARAWTIDRTEAPMFTYNVARAIATRHRCVLVAATVER